MAWFAMDRFVLNDGRGPATASIGSPSSTFIDRVSLDTRRHPHDRLADAHVDRRPVTQFSQIL